METARVISFFFDAMNRFLHYLNILTCERFPHDAVSPPFDELFERPPLALVRRTELVREALDVAPNETSSFKFRFPHLGNKAEGVTFSPLSAD